MTGASSECPFCARASAGASAIPRFTGDVEDPRGGVRRVLRAKAPYWKESK